MKTKPITRPMTKSPRRVAREAYAVAREALPAYACRTSRKDFTQPQLFAVLALKTFLETDYRGVVAGLADFPELRADLGLAKVHHYSTLCYAERRLLQRGLPRPAAPRLRPRPPARPGQGEARGGRRRDRAGHPHGDEDLGQRRLIETDLALADVG